MAEVGEVRPLGDKLGLVAEHIIIFIEPAGLAQVSIRLRRASSKISAAALGAAGSVASFKTQVSRTTLKIWPCPLQGALAPFGLYKCDRFLVTQALPLILPVSACQSRRKFETDHFSIHDGGCMHGRN